MCKFCNGTGALVTEFGGIAMFDCCPSENCDAIKTDISALYEKLDKFERENERHEKSSGNI